MRLGYGTLATGYQGWKMTRNQTIDRHTRNMEPAPRFFASLAPWWALYSFGVLWLGAMTGLTGWMMHRGQRLIWAALTAIGAGTIVAAGGLLWQRSAWQQRARRWQAFHPASGARIANMDRRTGHTVRVVAALGLAILAAAVRAGLRQGPARYH